jgi:hypothetical protein
MNRDRIIRTIGLSLVAAISFIDISPAASANLRAIPSVALEERWDSNVFSTSSDEESDFVFRASPKLALSIDTFQSTVDLSGGIDFEKYAEHTELEANPVTKYFQLTMNTPLRVTPRFSARPSARYVETRDAIRRIELTQAPEPGLPPSESFVSQRTEVQEISGSMQLTYVLAPNVDLGIGGGAVRREFSEETSGLVDSRTLTGNASIAYRLTSRFTSGLYFDTSYNSFDNRPNSRTYAGGLSGTYLLTEKFTIDARAGASLARESTGVGDEKTDTWSPSGKLSITYAQRDLRATLLGSYELAGAGSLGRTTRRGNVVLTLTDRFAPRWSWNISGYYQTNRSTDDVVTEDLVSASGTAGIAYQAAEWASLRLSANAFRQWSHGLTGDDLERNSVMLGITLSNVYPVF